MSALLAALRFARWPLLVFAVVATTGCAAIRIARWATLVFIVAGATGCGTFGDHCGCQDDSDGDQVRGSQRGGSVSPDHLNARPSFLNG
jgi:hypothetical protein